MDARRTPGGGSAKPIAECACVVPAWCVFLLPGDAGLSVVGGYAGLVQGRRCTEVTLDLRPTWDSRLRPHGLG